MSKRPVIDPRLFISGPFVSCPYCGQPDGFGVVSIGGNRYTRRCRECWRDKTYPLPMLQKKLVYLDQFAISEMMKAINAKLGKQDKVDPFWLGLFERLDSLIAKQLIICPDSHFHQRESLVNRYKPLKRMYEHLSRGVTFNDAFTIQRFQVCHAFRQSLGLLPSDSPPLTVDDVVHGTINEWQEKFTISVNPQYSDEYIAEIRRMRGESHAALEKLAEQWRMEKARRFDDRVHAEGLAFGQSMWQQYFAGLAKYYKIEIGEWVPTAEEVMSVIMSNSAVLMTSLRSYLPRSEDPGQLEANLRTIGEFLGSDAMLAVPFNRLAAGLWAGLAHRIANDAHRPAPNQGTVTDIDMVSVLLPYCDAMLVDRDMQELLNYGPVKQYLAGHYNARVFSMSTRDELMAYLDEVEKGADPSVIAAVSEVYGDATPFTSLYEHSRED